jgi:hypothetical protein
MKLKKLRIKMRDVQVGDVFLDKNKKRVVVTKLKYTLIHDHVYGFKVRYLDEKNYCDCDNSHWRWDSVMDVWRVVE